MSEILSLISSPLGTNWSVNLCLKLKNEQNCFFRSHSYYFRVNRFAARGVDTKILMLNEANKPNFQSHNIEKTENIWFEHFLWLFRTLQVRMRVRVWVHKCWKLMLENIWYIWKLLGSLSFTSQHCNTSELQQGFCCWKPVKPIRFQ